MLSVVNSKLYAVAANGAAAAGGGLRTEAENFWRLLELPSEQLVDGHSVRGDITVPELREEMVTSRCSQLMDLAVCKSSRVRADIQGDVSVLDPSVLEKFVQEVARLEPVNVGDMLIVIASSDDRTKDSRHIEDQCGRRWSYLGDPAISITGYVPGEEVFWVNRVDLIFPKGEVTYRANGRRGRLAERLVSSIKRALANAADPNSYSEERVYWGNFFEFLEMVSLLKGICEAVGSTGKLEITAYSGEEVALKVSVAHGSATVTSEMGRRGYIEDMTSAVRELVLDRRPARPSHPWRQGTAHTNISRLVRFGQVGYNACRLKLYLLTARQIRECGGFEVEDLTHSRVINELLWDSPLDDEQRQVAAALAELDGDFSISRDRNGVVSLMGLDVQEDEFREACTGEYDIDEKGVASTMILSRGEEVRWNGVKLKPGHGKKVGHCTTRLTYWRGLSRLVLNCEGGKLYSSRGFTPSDLTRLVTKIREVEVMSGKIVWQDATDREGPMELNNSMFNLLLSGAGGKNVGFWLLGLIRSGDICMKSGVTQACYVKNHQSSPNSRYVATAALDGNVFRMLHTYTDGRDLWVDFEDNNNLEKVTVTDGDLPHVQEETGKPRGLKECQVAGTVRLLDNWLSQCNGTLYPTS
ncbi:unnamed protein product [Chondrus crispus]|uniref:Uncharacterized protein n=1 Tax=Chondrus crispus TaxID=2769 RepID=R7Q4C0_CHOCR|nr:unnamed protein product [Chondrus crispus]CDF32859.1 unnamed protein product [Chondrus crispus]|eukprot:XP_005712660.1 unnamed protein product [Chondrus crispus]